MAFRTLFGLSLPFGEDPRSVIGWDSLQTYLIGLQFACSLDWPFYGPDIYEPAKGVYNQIPGALEGLLVGVPLLVFRFPESPFILLNLFSLGALAFLAWNIHRRLPGLSFPFVLTYLALLPWNLHGSTNTYNPSYLLLGSVVFFVGFMESIPSLSTRGLKPFWAFLSMGLGLFYCMQFHASWVLLLPFLLFAFLSRGSQREPLPLRILGFLSGSSIPIAFLLPTYFLTDPIEGPSALLARMIPFNSSNFLLFFTVLARYLSLACFEIPRFLGVHTVDRIEYLGSVPWIIPPALFLTLAGWIQALAMAGFPLTPWARGASIKKTGYVTFGAFFLLWGTFWVTDRSPITHFYYILFPLPALYFFHLWNRVFPGRKGSLPGALLIGASLWFQGGVMVQALRGQTFFTHRENVKSALDQRDPRILGERRPYSALKKN